MALFQYNILKKLSIVVIFVFTKAYEIVDVICSVTTTIIVNTFTKSRLPKIGCGTDESWVAARNLFAILISIRNMTLMLQLTKIKMCQALQNLTIFNNGHADIPENHPDETVLTSLHTDAIL